MSQTKKGHASVSMTRAKNHTLYDEELRAAKATPGPLCYAPSHALLERAGRGGSHALGLGAKATAAVIAPAPGPGHYEVNPSSINPKTSHNLALKTGGPARPAIDHKEDLILKSLKQHQATRKNLRKLMA